MLSRLSSTLYPRVVTVVIVFIMFSVLTITLLCRDDFLEVFSVIFASILRSVILSCKRSSL